MDSTDPPCTDLPGSDPPGTDPPVTNRRWPLSYTQEFLWFLGRRWPDTDMRRRFTVSLTIELDPAVPTARIEQVLQELVDEHEVLRSEVVDEPDDPNGPWIRIRPSVLVRVRERDLAEPSESPPSDDAADVVDRALAAAAAEPVPATEAPAARFDLVRTPTSAWLGVTVHHLFFDHWSASLLRRELDRRLSLPSEPGPETEPLETGPQYVDFAVWERELVASPQAQSGVDYWVQRLADLPVMALPTDRPRPWIRSAAAGRLVTTLPAAEYAAVHRLARTQHASAFMVLATGFLALLSNLTGSLDVAVPIVFAGHRRGETTRMLGYFDNLLFLRTRFDVDADVAETLRRTREDFLDAYEHHETPILAVMERQPRLLFLLGDPRNVWVLFHLQVDPESLSTPRLDATPGRTVVEDRLLSGDAADILSETATYNFGADLDVTLREVDGELQIALLYSTDLFDPDRLRGWLDSFRVGLRASAADPTRQLLPLFAPVDRDDPG